MKSAHRPPHFVIPRRVSHVLRPLAFACLLLCFVGALPLASSKTAGAQGGLTAADQAVLDQVRALVAAPSSLKVQLTSDGGSFVDLRGGPRKVVLARVGPDGRLITACVGSVEEAAAFLSGAAPLAAEAITPDAAALRHAVESNPTLRRAALDANQTTITVNPGAGFSDSTAASPVGGNTGTSIGAQRLIAFQYAASIWASYLQTTVPVVIDAQFSLLGCGILGSASPQTIARDFAPSSGFPGPEHADTWYVSALANKRAGHDLNQATGDISASFTTTIRGSNCAPAGSWYYGLDGKAPGGSTDLVSVLLHEFGHGLGFSSFVQATPGSYGQMYPDGRNDIWNYFLYDDNLGKHFKDMTVLERSIAITDTNALVWDGPAVTAAARSFLYAPPILTITAPLAAGGPYNLSGASFGSPVADPPLGASLVDAADACAALANPSAVVGKIALINQGGCNFTVKVKNAQDAGAVGALIVNNVAGGPPTLTGSDATITIVAVGIAQADGAALRTALGSGTVSVQIGRDITRLSGADSAGRVRLYAPGGVSSGSSVSHFDISAAPNLLMEPFLNSDISQGLDLTDDLLRDIGWYPDVNYNGIPDPNELDLAVALAASPTSELAIGSALTITLSLTSSGALGASAAHLVDTFPAQLANISWTASYSGGATGLASGSGNIDTSLVMPSGSKVTIVITASVAGPARSITNTATVTSGGVEVDSFSSNNQASVIVYLASEETYVPLVIR